MENIKRIKNTPWIPKSFVVFAINKSNNPDEELSYINSNIVGNVIQCEGCYNGEKELSYIVDINNIDQAVILARRHKQESILIVKKSIAELFFLNINTFKSIGLWKQVSKESAENKEAYTVFNGQYFVVD